MSPRSDDVPEARLSRRQLARRLAAAGFAAPVIAAILAAEGLAQGATPGAGLDPRPVPEDMPLGVHDDAFLTPNERFFVRSRGAVPDLDPRAWRLRVSGLVVTPMELSLDDLMVRESVTVTSVLECSGNGRGHVLSDGAGAQWSNAAVGNATWTGVPLRSVLDEAGIRPGAREVVSRGGDRPEMRRGLPMDSALAPDTMVVWEMNGEPLSAAHGGPARLLVPGWGGIASTKWLVGLEVIDHVFQGPVDTGACTVADPLDRRIRPVREMPVKAVIASPAPNARLAAGEQVVTGFAWSGYGRVTRVEVSIDGGGAWAEAEIVERAGHRSWVRFAHRWTATPGETTLAARATDALTLTQPSTVPRHARGYSWNAVVRVPVMVGG